MAQIPAVAGTLLQETAAAGADGLTVGSSAWFGWLADDDTRSFSFRSPAGNALAGLGSTHGARVIDSTPPDTTTAASPDSPSRTLPSPSRSPGGSGWPAGHPKTLVPA